MNDGLRQRLVGTAAVLVAALVFIPLFFDGDGYRERHLPSNIPPGPELAEIVSIEPQLEALPDTQAVAPALQPRDIEPVVEAVVPVRDAQPVAPDLELSADTPVLDEQNVPVAWTLQLASFKDEANAKSLRKKLVGSGHKVYTRRIGELVKVYVGPDIQRSKLEALQAELKKDFDLNGIIVRFTTQ
ncbi:SPOR domain-containing protein [Marinobacterium rhizophilum]|uniref:SPOR domain-containing protein n=1 Tax=Marinobacterium rhizophilum TaxID=420402 RepID=UPI0003611155|nr:SPOR domain-containing protein [Marinobacterium rhizophilum]